MKGPQDDTCAHKVRSDFMARYKWPDDQADLKEKWIRTLEKCCEKLATQEIYQVRIYAVMAYHIEILKEFISFDEAKLVHLEANQYRRVPFIWINTDDWEALSNWWATDSFKRLSALKRNARLSRPESTNRGGSSSVARTQQILERTYGRTFSIIEAYAVHMGASKQAVAEGEGNDLPPIPDERAQENLDKYRDGMQAAHGPNVIWVRAPLDAEVMYECTGLKAHGMFAMADGAIDSSEVQLSTNAHPSHTYTTRPSQIEVELRQELANFKRQRQEDCQLIRNALSEFNNQIMEYMMNGSTSTPPPQINLAALFPSHSSSTTQQNATKNSSRNMFNQTDGSNRGNCSQQDASLSNNRQGGVGNNSENVVLQRMDGSTFGYSRQQIAPATNQGNSKRGRDGDFVDSEDEYADDGNYDDADGTPDPFFSLFGI